MKKKYILPISGTHSATLPHAFLAGSDKDFNIFDKEEVNEQGGKQNPFWEDAEEGDDAWHNGASR